MPEVNPLIQGVMVAPAVTAQTGGMAGRSAAPNVGGIQIALGGLVAVALLGLVLLHRAGFSFHVTVG